MFVRFVLLRPHPDTGVEEGIFESAYDLKRGGTLSEHEVRELGALLDWFGDKLERPNRFNRTKSKGYYRRATKGVSWFKPTANEHISRMHALTSILREHGHQISLIKTRNPGYVVYEDDYQVVAEPFSDERG